MGVSNFPRGKIYYYVTLYVYYFYTELLVIRDTICLPLKPLRNTIRLISKGKIYYYAKVMGSARFDLVICNSNRINWRLIDLVLCDSKPSDRNPYIAHQHLDTGQTILGDRQAYIEEAYKVV